MDSRRISRIAALGAVALVLAIGGLAFFGGPSRLAIPILSAVCAATILLSVIASRSASRKFVKELQNLLPSQVSPEDEAPEQVLQCLDRQICDDRAERSKAFNLLAKLPYPCMTVICSGAVTWRNEAMAALLDENGPAGDKDPIARFCSRTSAKTWENLRSGQWSETLLRVERPDGTASLFQADLVEIGGAEGCWLCLFQDVTQRRQCAMQLEAQNDAIKHLNAQIEKSAAIIESLGREISGALTSLVDSMHDSKDRAQQVAQAMQEMTDNVRMVATMAAETAKTATGAEDRAREGVGAIKQTSEVQHKVVDSYDRLTGILSQLVDKAGSVENVVGIISDIADQTNLLALNAAIEAARAGESGRGFAVVADEVRKLAEKTLQATRNVREAVQGIETCSHQAVAAMASTNQDIKTSYDLVLSAEGKFAAIAEAMVSASRGIDDIAHRAERQCASSFEINMCAMDVTDNSQEVYEQVHRTSQQLQRLVEDVSKVRTLAADALLGAVGLNAAAT
jgi:methyl-accepting chemotaxis protein